MSEVNQPKPEDEGQNKKPNPSDKEIEKLLNKFLKKQSKEFEGEITGEITAENRPERKQIQRDVAQLDYIVSEYLQNFIILGYDLEGRKLSLFHAKNEAEKDALLEHLRVTVMKWIMGDQ